MALNGRKEDLNLLEILQIVAFSKKTGTLAVLYCDNPATGMPLSKLTGREPTPIVRDAQ